MLNYVVSFSLKQSTRGSKPYISRKKLFGFIPDISNVVKIVESQFSSTNLLNLIRDRISLSNNDNTQQNNNNNQQNNEASNLSMFASNVMNNNNNNSNNNKSGKISPTSITFSNEELEDIDKLNNKLRFYNNNNQYRSPAHEFEMLSSGVDSTTTKSCKVVGYIEYDPLNAAFQSHKKSSQHRKNPFFNLSR